MDERVGNYLRARRRRWALTQEELAFLLGYKSETVVSRFERRERRITLAIAFAFQLIFGTEPKELFPTLFEQVEDGVVRRMYELSERLAQSAQSPKVATKLQLLREALSRATKSPPVDEV